MNLHTLPLTLRQLQYAVAVADELNFRRAAERCAVSQPSLSAQVAELERALGVQLFERDRRGVMVTAAGRQVVARAREALLVAGDVADVAAQFVDPLRSTLRVGIIPTIGPYLLPDLTPALKSAFPKLDVRWTEEKTDVLVERVIAGDLDAAILALEAGVAPLEAEPLGEDPFVLAVPPDHRLASLRREIRREELVDEDVLLLDDGHCFRDQALDLCTMSGARELGFRATSLATMLQMVAGGAGVTLLPAMSIEVENRRGALHLLRFEPPAPHRTIGLAWRARSPWDGPLREIAAVARSTCT